MSRGRTAAVVVALIVMITLCGACSSGSSKASIAAADRRAAAEDRAAAAKRSQAAVAKRQAATARRISTITAVPHKKKKPAPATTTTIVETQASTSPSGDLAAIEQTVNALNAAFRASVASGITDSEGANYWVGAGLYSSGQCGTFETARGEGIVSETIIVQPESLVPAPGWVDPVIGQVPQGRIYQMAIQEIQTLVTTGQERVRNFAIHVTVRSDGSARLFLRCA